MSSFEPVPLLASDSDDFVRKASSGGSTNPASKVFVPLQYGSEVADEDETPEPTPEEIRAQAYAEGVEAGRSELPWQEFEQLRALIETLDKALAAVANLRREYVRDQRVAVVELAISIAEKLVRRQIELDATPLVAIIERAVASLPDEGKLSVAISSEDHEALQAGLADEFASFGHEAGVALQADAELGRGDVRVRGERGVVDARVSSLLARVREALEDLQDIPEARS